MRFQVDHFLRLGLVLAFLLAFGLNGGLFLLLPSGGFLSARVFLSSSSDGCSHEDVRVSFLQLWKDFLSVLCLRKAVWKQIYRLKDFVLERRVGDDCDRLLQHIVAILVGHQSLHNLVHTKLAAPRLVAKLTDEDLIIPEVGALKDLVDLVGSLGGFKTLLNHIRRKL